MELPFVRRSAFAALESYADTEIWSLRRQLRELRERETARIACVEALERELSFKENECECLQERLDDLIVENAKLAQDNRGLRWNYDKTRAELSRARHENTELTLMKNSLEARLAVPCEVED